MIYFSDYKNFLPLKTKMDMWQGVPYRHMGNTKHGIDCTKLVGQLLIEADILQEYEDETFYPQDWFYHYGEEKIIESLKNNEKNLKKNIFLKIYTKEEAGEIKNGDLLIFRMFKSAACSHVGIFTKGYNKDFDKIFHVDRRMGCLYTQYSYSWKKRTEFIGRLEIDS